MQLAQSAQYRFVQRHIVLDDQSRVFSHHLVQHLGDTLFVAAAFWLDRKPAHRRRKFEGPHMDLIFVVRIVQHAVEVDLVDFRDGGDIAWVSVRHFNRFGALQHQQMPDLERLRPLPI